MKILWDERAWEEYLEWQKQDKKTLKRIIIASCKGHYED